jgi:hypothetical protein
MTRIMPDDTPMEACWCHVPTAELDARPLRAAISPLLTVFTLTRDALQDGRRGTPAAWRKVVLSTMRQSDITAFAPLTDPKTAGWPTLLDDIAAPRETLDEALQRVAAIPGMAILEALDSDRDVTPTAAWDQVRRDPDRWLSAYVDALYRSGRGLAPLWLQSKDPLEREVERIDAAMEGGVAASQIAYELNASLRLVDDALRLAPGLKPRRLGVEEDGLVVAPIIAGPNAGAIATPGDFLVWIGYALPNAWRTVDDKAPAGSLQALLGVYRTALLQRLDSSESAGRLAQMIDLTPGAVTFHLRVLEAAGLIVRERRGRNVIVQRTTRGTQLLALFEMG